MSTPRWTDLWGSAPDWETIVDPQAERVNAMLTALSEAVTHAQDQLPESQAQVWRDAERLVWKALGVSHE